MDDKTKHLGMQSTIKEVYSTPAGHDIISKILMQCGLGDGFLRSGPVSAMKVSFLSHIVRGKIGLGFFDTFFKILNENPEKPLPLAECGEIKKAWWKEAVFYQIYPKSFADSNGDGIGDIRGMISKLDYLKELGVDCLWLSPVYDSPMDDNGYDIRDYRKILKAFGTMEDFDELLAKTHEKGMRLIMDLVVNHTSDEHEWFKKALQDPKGPYHDYYFFRKKPNNWSSMFLGSAWNEYPEIDESALHLFSKKQMDLNWDNKAVRDEVIDMINWWLDKGVDGFRMDVINLISKEEGLPDGDKLIGDLIGVRGIENYFYGPHLHDYLKEINQRAFAPHNAFSVGETPGLGIEMSRLVTGDERNELNMVFNFDHLETPGHTRADDYRYDLNYYKEYISQYMTEYGNNCWMSLFYNNHDNPKMSSKVNPEKKWQEAIQKLLAVMQFTLKGSPFVFQGEEMGLSNYVFTSIEEVTDVESRNHYRELTENQNKSKEEAMALINCASREHGRVLLPWNTEAARTNPLVLQQKINPVITELYRYLIKLRKDNPELIYGDFKKLDGKKNKFTYSRGKDFIIDCNLDCQTIKAWSKTEGYELIYTSGGDGKIMAGYECRIYRRKQSEDSI